MNQTLSEFKGQKSKNEEALNKLLAFITEGKVLGVEIDEAYFKKLQTALSGVSEQKLKIALIGGFSEGKTSIAAAWLEKFDKQSMKINHQESSDEVAVYNIDDDLELIDTPGLFGFKEKINDEKKIEKYKDITKKYISEAHIILYVLNSSNPIKDSHKEDLNWLFRSLNLLSRTIFVLSRFDEIADVEDELEYQKAFEIKKQNVSSRLEELIDLSAEEKQNLCVVAVAANPFDEGAEYWLSHLEEFKKLSHIENLQKATKEKISQNGGKLALVEEAKQSIIQDILYKQLPTAKEANQVLNEELLKLDNIYKKTQKDLSVLNEELTRARIKIREFAVNYFSDLIKQLDGTSMETINDFIVAEIGEGGSNIDARVQNEFERQTGRIKGEIHKVCTYFDSEVSMFHQFVSSELTKKGVKFLADPKIMNATNVKLARDTIVKGAKMIGLDLGLKFKPWGAVNLASKASAVLAVVGVALEIWDSYKQAQRQKEFEEAKGKMRADFESQKKEILDLVDDDTNFKERFFPEAFKLEQSLKELEEGILKQEENQKAFQKWLSDGEIIEVEFKVEK
ncbi:labile enterotoxin output A [Campylobacter sp. MIT 99-7217]|uniref:LeoA/HP0731 family dynamin-like GTPase n=1 Tax=Campylobacter sp. MIT 99-7217 TaxID=535091 RepID=UPI00115A3933|nr:LeoA/HP0731 family dynamin-like GTPase [Campylobacter sp. MIT 99-7217]TQR31300.1 labile enterotoxin output A [Campylobacter sp. MIT 99-7217]